MADYSVGSATVLSWPLHKLLALTKRAQRRRAADRRWLIDAAALSMTDKPDERYKDLMAALGAEEADGGGAAEEMNEAQFAAFGGRTKVVERTVEDDGP